ncbi:hypothetical protein LEP1GSC064_1943 [Leptospira kirschneri serovar Grippotyphosa str. Moskva]|nr:hypothetical protein LEP1GSC064_1943 [Leptospira kirschneri serovar Grippotyphosa str. Moskva]EMN26109.1 hypothetical protein LEP1GSC065_1216 [Leptospira kirschneri serovar Sokoine str. RM1]
METDFNLCSISIGVRQIFLANNDSIFRIPFSGDLFLIRH